MDGGGGGEQREKDEGSWVVVKPNLGGDSEIPRCWSSASSGSVGHEGLNSQWGSGGNNNVGGLSKKAYYVAMSRWKEFSCQELLFQAEARAMSSVTETPQLQYQVPVPHPHSYDLNLTPEATVGALNGESISKFAPVTPDKSVRVVNSDVDDIRDQETEKQKNEITTTMKSINELYNNEESPRPAESSLAVDTTKLQEDENPDKGDSQVIDLNKTPQPKQRRKKHRPKVITEGKPRTPKPKTPNPTDSKTNPTGKRTYVRKKKIEIASETPPEVAEPSGDFKTRTPRKRPCKRVLNFEEMEPEAKDSLNSSFDVNSEMQGPNFCTGRVSESTIQLCSRIEEVMVRNRQAGTIDHERAVQVMLDGNAPPCTMSLNDSDCSTSASLRQGHEQAKYAMGSWHYAHNQAETGGLDIYGVYHNSLHAYQFNTWWNKKRRTDKGQNNATSSAIFCSPTRDFGGKVIEKDCGRALAASAQAGQSLQGNLQTNEYIIMSLSPNERPTKKRSRSATRARDQASLTRIAVHRMGTSYPTEPCYRNNNEERVGNLIGPGNCIDALIAQTRETLARKSRTKKRNSGVSTTKMLSVDAIERQLNCLDINRESRFSYQERNAIVPFNIRYQEQNALILYRRDGTIVPFAGSFDPVKKPRPRPKVELDEETNRVWKLLLENINSEGIDGTDEEKAKWWEEERKVFHGRADSFIARMHLVQGDRRFSQWKGSVLDSVVGVFLTQNVSDHLSSSAFMSLAARFPLKSRNHGKACRVSDEPEACISEITPNQPVCEMTSFTPLGAEHNDIPVAADCCLEQDGKRTGLISLQTSVDSTTSQSCEKSGSCSGSNSDIEDLPNRSIYNGLEYSSSSLQNLHKDESSTLLEAYQGSARLPADEKLKGDCNDSKATEHDNKRQNIDKASPKGYFESNNCLHEASNEEVVIIGSFDVFKEETQSSDMLQDQSTVTVESASQNVIQEKTTVILQDAGRCPNVLSNNIQEDKNLHIENFEAPIREENNRIQHKLPNHYNETQENMKKTAESDLDKCGYSLSKECSEIDATTEKAKGKRIRKEKKEQDWDELRKRTEANGQREKTEKTMNSLDWEAVRCADVDEIADTIKERGMNNKLAERIKDFLNRMVREHGDTDLEWLRDVPPDQAKEYLLSIRGLGLKSVECVRLLTLHHLAFPVDTNVGRIAVRLGWVPLQPLPESLQLHLLELYPVLESIQKYLWPRLCKLDQRTLYELHYQMITFGKVFCTKNKPNCNACPMRGECRHFASAFASARLALPGPEEKGIVIATEKGNEDTNLTDINKKTPLPLPDATKQSEEERSLEALDQSGAIAGTSKCEPIIEEPATPEPECTNTSDDLKDIEDAFFEDPDEIPTIKLNIEEFTQNLQNYMQKNMELQDGDMSKALVALGPEAASIPTPKLKNVSRLRTEHQVYELPDSHPLLEMLQFEKREPDDPSPYLLAIWTPGETIDSIEPPESSCCSQGSDKLCNKEGCFSCNSVREANSQTVRGTVLIPCRTAMRGSFPLNGTYFQVNEMFADHETSLKPIDVPRAWIWNLPRRTVYFGTSIPTIFRGLTTQGIQQCFWRGYVCVRGFDRKTRAPRPLIARLHFPVSKGRRTRDPKNDE